MNNNVDVYLNKLGFEALTPMQEEVCTSFDLHKDIVLLSPTGSGKTLAFLLPILSNLKEGVSGIQAVIISPTRELALQIETVFKSCKSPFKINVVYGGHSMRTEKQSLEVLPTVLVATPGRLCDHLSRETLKFNNLQYIVLDEFDKSLEMGFQEEMAFILSHIPQGHSTFLSSATTLDEIPEFTGIKEPKTINFLDQLKPKLSLKAAYYGEEEKLPILFEVLCSLPAEPTMIFCNHREATMRICEHLQEMGVPAIPFHGAMEQQERERSLIRFRNGSSHYLVATDLAARGLDIPDVGTVIHYQLPLKEDAFIHRNGRTARMKEKGQAIVLLEQGRDIPDFLNKDLTTFQVSKNLSLPEYPKWDILYFSGGKKDKINKIDLVGFLSKKGELEKHEIGLITVLDHWSYVAVPAKDIKTILHKIRREKVKGKRLKIDISL
jgi:ATP-independent RNA helicase DbpA